MRTVDFVTHLLTSSHGQHGKKKWKQRITLRADMWHVRSTWGPPPRPARLRVSRHALSPPGLPEPRRRIDRGEVERRNGEGTIPCQEYAGLVLSDLTSHGQRSTQLTGRGGCSSPVESGLSCGHHGTDSGVNAFAVPHQWWVGSWCGF